MNTFFILTQKDLILCKIMALSVLSFENKKQALETPTFLTANNNVSFEIRFYYIFTHILKLDSSKRSLKLRSEFFRNYLNLSMVPCYIFIISCHVCINCRRARAWARMEKEFHRLCRWRKRPEEEAELLQVILQIQIQRSEAPDHYNGSDKKQSPSHPITIVSHKLCGNLKMFSEKKSFKNSNLIVEV